MLWKNWSGQHQFQPQQWNQPSSTEEIQKLVQNLLAENRSVRVTGSAHSFSPLVPGSYGLIGLDNLRGVVDHGSDWAWVNAGTKLHELGAALNEIGLAQENLGDIDVQSIAGSLSTGTHGTGTQFGNLATQIEAMEIIDGHGQIQTIDSDSPQEVYQSARLALGSMGIISKLKLRLIPAYKLKFSTGKESLKEVLHNYPAYNRDNRNFEFYWFPFSGMVQTKFSNTSTEAIKENSRLAYLSDVVLENYLFKILSEACRIFPSLCPSVSKLSAWGVSTSSKINWSHKVYALPRLVRFNEMEYNIPAEAFSEVVERMQSRIKREKFRVHFPIECRFVKGDDLWLSPAYQRESAYIAIHMYKGMPFQEYFEAMEEIFSEYEGRPHWGKMHNKDADYFRRVYPRFDDFLEQRSKFDPKEIFVNDHLRKIFGLNNSNAESSSKHSALSDAG